MPRLAGSSRFYRFAITDPKGKATKHGFDLPSVTTISGLIDKVPPEWGAKVTREGVWALTEGEGVLTLSGPEELAKLLKGTGHNPYAVRKAAGDRGTAVHQLIEDFYSDKPPVESEIPSELKGYYDGFRKWHTFVKPQVFAVEEPVWSLRHRFCGTLDLAYHDEDRICIVDFKTSSGIRDGGLLQLAGLRLAFEETHGIEVSAAKIVRVTADGEFEVKESNVDTSAFVAALDLWRAFNGKEK